MSNQQTASVENNFTKGLLTEFTGLNFPENAATDTDNCVYTLLGDVTRRLGFDYEANPDTRSQDRADCVTVTYKWNNAGGDGTTQIVVEQVGNAVRFYRSSSATVGFPLSTKLLASIITLSDFTAPSTAPIPPATIAEFECQFTDGNGYLFIYHPYCDPIYCTYDAGTIVGNRITVQIRDVAGVYESTPVNLRPTGLTTAHSYNLLNQGWVTGNAWSSLSTTNFSVGLGSAAFTVAAGLPGVTGGTRVKIDNSSTSFGLNAAPPGVTFALGTVTSYVGTTLTINVDTVISPYTGYPSTNQLIYPVGTGYLSTWATATGNYPSNADTWWRFKNSSDVFDPATTLNNVTISTGSSSKGHFILDAFNQQREAASNIVGVVPVITAIRPKTGTWFQGRVWYAGVDAQQPAIGNAAYYSWTENIYFSQIVTDVNSFGNCYKFNDPTSQELFDDLPTDGGVIRIQGCGSVYKLFPIQNGLLVFAANGIWFITGNQGVGFTANDYTVMRLSDVRSISGTSFVNVNGLPYFWNEEGIYSVQPLKDGGLQVEPITVGTILSFYSDIPISSKKYVRGAYNPIEYIIQWTYRSTEAAGAVNTRYEYDRILNYNTYNKAFYPYSVYALADRPSINGIIYVASPGVSAGQNAPEPGFKYPCSFYNGVNYDLTFAEERDTSFQDWASIGAPKNYVSYFVTGYKVHGQAYKKIQLPYIVMYSRNDQSTSYKIQGIWDYAGNGNSGRYSSIQRIDNTDFDNYGMVYRRHRIRGRGLALQIKVISVDQRPFDIMGWSAWETQQASIY